MAKTGRAATARRNTGSARAARGVYVEGNAVRKLQEAPQRRSPRPQHVNTRKRTTTQVYNAPKQQHQLSREAQRNREKAMGMNRGFVVFLAVVSVAILFCCINYLRYKSEITGKISNVASLEAELAELKEDNDAYYSQVTSNVDLDQIKKIAIGRLGMKYPSEEQTVTYTTEGSSYVRQYQDIPDPK